MPDVQTYIKHVGLYGPDCILESAAGDLAEKDLGELSAYLDHKGRTQRWFVAKPGHNGGWWVDRPERARRACEHCGLDLSVGSRRNTRFHPHCRSRASRRRTTDTETARVQ